MLDLCVDQLLERFEIQCRKHVYNYPFLMGQGCGWIQTKSGLERRGAGGAQKHGTLSVGFIGLAETLKCLVGAHHGERREGPGAGLEIISHMRARMDAESARRGLNFSLLATPPRGCPAASSSWTRHASA